MTFRRLIAEVVTLNKKWAVKFPEGPKNPFSFSTDGYKLKISYLTFTLFEEFVHDANFLNWDYILKAIQNSLGKIFTAEDLAD